MCKRIIFIFFAISVFCSELVLAQTTRSLSGTVSLDVTPSEKNRVIEITVNNHSFVVIPPNFAIIRPITSKQSRLFMLPAGESSVNYVIDNIIDDPDRGDPVDYTVALKCIGCATDFPVQYYSPGGNKFGLANSTYIDPNDLPPVLNLTAITRASITGEIDLGRIADRDLTFSVVVSSAQDPQRIFSTNASIRLRAGSSKTSYTISGLRRSIGNDEYRVQLECTNCFAQSKQPQVFANTLSPNKNHTDINFSVTDGPPISLAPIVDLLLH